MDRNVQAFPTRRINWRGRSGRLYVIEPVRLNDFALRNNEIYLIALGSHVLWTGSAEDVIHDATSRASFRLALDCADRAYRVDATEDEVERMTMIWDLDGAEPVTGVVAA